MKKSTLITFCLGCLLAGGLWAQQKAQIRIKKNINGIESEETREVIIDENNGLEEVLRELNSQPEQQNGNIDQQIEISILSEGAWNDGQEPGKRSLNMPNLPGLMQPQRKPTLGVMLREVACREKKCEHETHVTVTEVVANTPAAKAGLQAGDIILKINKEEVSSSQQVIQMVQSYSSKGGELDIVVNRSGKRKKIKAIIEPAATFESTRNEFNLLLGPDSITMFNLILGDSMKILQPFNLSSEGFSDGESAFLGVMPSGKTATAGVSIRVEENSPAESMGLIDDDIILEFNGEVIGDFTSLSEAVRKQKPESSVDILILREGKEKHITGTLGKRKLSTANDFQIFHDFKGMDDEGNYFYDFEFNMDADDIERQMQEMFRNFNQDANPFVTPWNGNAKSLLRLEELNPQDLSKMELTSNSLSFEHLSIIPNADNGNIEIDFKLLSEKPFTVIMKDSEAHTLLYDELQQPKENYRRIIALSGYPVGDYFLVIEQEGKSFSKKIVKYEP